MNALAARIAEEYAAASGALPAQIVSLQRRRRAIENLAAQGLPGTRDENWRYANLRSLERVRFAPAAKRTMEIAPGELPATIPGYARQVFVDGLFVPALSSAAPGLFTHARPHSNAGAGEEAPHHPDERFALLNEAFASDAGSIHAAAGGDEPERLEILFVATADGAQGASYPRLDIALEPHANLHLIERHVSLGAAASFVDVAVGLDLGDASSLTHYRVQQVGERTTWLDTLAARLGSDASYHLHLVSLGALSARSTLRVQLLGERAQVRLHAAAVAERQQVHDLYALIEHVAPHARTEQVFRGIAAGRARVACNGKIVVASAARGTDSRQSLRGLLAGPDAEIDLRPQLEIHTDEVRCSHGATAGKLDEAMLFYLLSRGLDGETAQRLLKWAFLADVVAKIAVPQLRRHLECSLAGRVDAPAELQELL